MGTDLLQSQETSPWPSGQKSQGMELFGWKKLSQHSDGNVIPKLRPRRLEGGQREKGLETQVRVVPLSSSDLGRGVTEHLRGSDSASGVKPVTSSSSYINIDII